MTRRSPGLPCGETLAGRHASLRRRNGAGRGSCVADVGGRSSKRETVYADLCGKICWLCAVEAPLAISEGAQRSPPPPPPSPVREYTLLLCGTYADPMRTPSTTRRWHLSVCLSVCLSVSVCLSLSASVCENRQTWTILKKTPEQTPMHTQQIDYPC